MTIKELKELIKDLPDDMEIIMQKDAEGNGYSPLEDVGTECVYIPENTYSGQVYWLDSTADDNCLSEKEWSEFKAKKRSLVLAPVN